MVWQVPAPSSTHTAISQPTRTCVTVVPSSTLASTARSAAFSVASRSRCCSSAAAATRTCRQGGERGPLQRQPLRAWTRVCCTDTAVSARLAAGAQCGRCGLLKAPAICCLKGTRAAWAGPAAVQHGQQLQKLQQERQPPKGLAISSCQPASRRPATGTPQHHNGIGKTCSSLVQSRRRRAVRDNPPPPHTHTPRAHTQVSSPPGSGAGRMPPALAAPHRPARYSCPHRTLPGRRCWQAGPVGRPWARPLPVRPARRQPPRAPRRCCPHAAHTPGRQLRWPRRRPARPSRQPLQRREVGLGKPVAAGPQPAGACGRGRPPGGCAPPPPAAPAGWLAPQRCSSSKAAG